MRELALRCVDCRRRWLAFYSPGKLKLVCPWCHGEARR